MLLLACSAFKLVAVVATLSTLHKSSPHYNISSPAQLIKKTTRLACGSQEFVLPLLALLYVLGSFGGCDAAAVVTRDRTYGGAVKGMGWGLGGCFEPSPTTTGGTNIL
ncbi:hypothetical protein Tco_1440031 [Tanacetum coccineum]